MAHRDVQSTLWNGIGPRGESQWGRRRRRRSNVHGSPTAQERLCFCLTRGVSNTRALEFESALERDTSMNSRLRDEGWIRVNNRESKWGDHHLPRSRQHSSTRGCHRDAWGIWRRSCYGMELCLRIENILKGSRKWFTRDKSRSVTCSSEVGNDPYVDWCGKCAGWSQERMVSNVEPPTARGRAASDPATRWLEGKAGECRTLAAWQEALLHERFSASEEGHSSITCSWRCSACKLWRQWGALQKVWMQKCGANRPEIRTWRWYQIWRDTSISAEKTIWWTWWAGPGLWDQHARSEEAVIECRAKYSSPTMIQLRTWTRNSVDQWDVFKSRARHLQEAEVQRSHQWDNQEWSRERDVTQRQVLQVIVSAQGAARRDCRFQAEHVEHGKIRTQCKGCSACDRQSGKTRRWRKDDRPSQCGSCFVVVVALVVAFVVVAFWPYVVSCSRSFCRPSPLFLLPSSFPSSRPLLKDNNLAPSNHLASIWHSQKYRTRVSAQFRFYTQINMVFTSVP